MVAESGFFGPHVNLAYIGGNKPEEALAMFGALASSVKDPDRKRHFIIADSWDAEEHWLRHEELPYIGHKDFPHIDGILNAKSLKWLADHGRAADWTPKRERSAEEHGVTGIADTWLGKQGWPQFATHSVKKNGKWREEFNSAHDSINDAVVTLLNALACTLAYSQWEERDVRDDNGQLLSWNSKPLIDFPFEWHMTAVDCEGFGERSGEHMRDIGVAHLRSRDVVGDGSCLYVF